MDEKVSNHPCHRLSIPSAKLFWCRHCMQSFEDPINRWRHSKTCKTGGPSNHDKRLEQEPFALQTYCEMKQREDAGGQSTQHGQSTQVIDTVTGEQLLILRQETVENEAAKAEYSCFICKRPFDSLEDMKEHVKYPCSKYDPYDYPIYIPGSGGTFVEAPKEIPDSFPSASRKFGTISLPQSSPPNVITRRPVLGEIIEQSADPQTGIRTFEVHSQNDDIPLSDILSKLSEGGYLVAGEDESTVNQVVVVQQVDEKGQITQTEHVLPPHIQIQNATDNSQALETEPVADEEANSADVTYYVSETGEVIEPFLPVPVKQEIKQELYYGDYGDQLSGMNILTQAAEATIGNLIYPEKRKNDDDEKEDKNVKRSRNQCKPDDDSPNQQPPHSPKSPRQPDGASWNGSSMVTIGNLSQVIKTEKCDSPNGGGKQQSSAPDTTDGKSTQTKEKKLKKSRKSCLEEFKCRICDKTFKTSQLLHRHSQFPCKVFNTRNMCQKVLRPKRGNVVSKALDWKKTMTKVSLSNSNPKSKSVNKAEIYRKPMRLLSGSLRVFSTLNTDRKPKPKIKKKISYIPTQPSMKTIWLPGKEQLTVKELSTKEQFFYEVGLVLCQHLTERPDMLEPNIVSLELQSQKIENVFTPLMISTDVECLRNCNMVEEFYSPPVLERMDISGSYDEKDLQEEPPVLIPIVDVLDKKYNKINGNDLIEPLWENEYQVLEFSESSTPIKDSTSKIAETKRHFMDLFLEASPSTAQKQDDHLRESGNNIENQSEDNLRKEMKIKEDVILKLTSDLKKKLSPPKLTELDDDHHSQNIPSHSFMNLSDVKRDIFSSFTVSNSSSNLIFENQLVEKSANSKSDVNIRTSTPLNSSKSNLEQHLNSATGKTFKIDLVVNSGKNLVTDVVKKSPSKINVIIYKCKAQLKDQSFDNHLSIPKSCLKDKMGDNCDETIEDEICETLDKMLSDISNKTNLQNELISKDQIINSETNADKSKNLQSFSYNSEDNGLVVSTNPTVISKKNRFSDDSSVSSHKIASHNNLKISDNNINDNNTISNNSATLSDNKRAFDTVDSDVERIELENLDNAVVECEKPAVKCDISESESENDVLKDENIVDDYEANTCEIIDFDQMISPELYSNISSPDTKSKFECVVETGKEKSEMTNIPNQNHLPQLFNLLVKNTNLPEISDKDEHFKRKSSMCKFPQFLMDEGIVSDITESKDESTNRMFDKTLFPNDLSEEKPKVTVQYIEQMHSSCPLTSDKLSYIIDDYDINKSNSDYLVNKIVLCEEEIVLSDSGLDDSDEPISQNSLDEDNITQTLQLC